MSSINRR